MANICNPCGHVNLSLCPNEFKRALIYWGYSVLDGNNETYPPDFDDTCRIVFESDGYDIGFFDEDFFAYLEDKT